MNSINKNQDEIVYNNILRKTRDLAFIYGLKRLTVDQIASECSISKKTIYKHFKNKNDLFLKAVDLFIQEGIDEVNKVIDSAKGIKERLLKLFEVPFHLFRIIPRIVIEDVFNYYPEIEERAQVLREIHKKLFIDTLEEGFKKGLFRKHNPILILNIFDAAGDRMLNTQFLVENNLTIEETVDCFRSLISEGLIIE